MGWVWASALVSAVCAASAAPPTGGAETDLAPPPALTVGGRIFARAEGESAKDYARELSLPSARLQLEARWKGSMAAVVEAELTDTRPLRDAFVELELGRGFEVTAGRFKAPFSARELVSRWKLEPIERGLVNDATREAGYAGRRVGAQLQVRPRFLRALTLSAGAFASGSEEGEDLAARARLKLWGGLTLGTGLYRRAGAAGGVATGADAKLLVGPARLGAELISLPRAASADAAPGGPGATVLAAWRVPLGGPLALEPYVDLEWFRADGSASASQVAGGLTLLRADALRAQVELSHGNSAPAKPAGQRATVQLGARF